MAASQHDLDFRLCERLLKHVLSEKHERMVNGRLAWLLSSKGNGEQTMRPAVREFFERLERMCQSREYNIGAHGLLDSAPIRMQRPAPRARVPRPEWMDDPTKLPKAPPGRS